MKINNKKIYMPHKIFIGERERPAKFGAISFEQSK